MTGSASTEHGEPTGQHGQDEPAGQDGGRRSGGFPWQVGVSVLAWIVLGGLLIASALGGSSTTSGADQSSIDSVRGALGASTVATAGTQGQHPTLYLMLGLVTLLMALMLLIGQGWARHVLALLGVASVILFAIGGRWEAIATFGLLVLGAVLLLNRPALRFLSQ